ncbi:hypothetical protein DXG03_006675 [Asterophora parasitica]|uniref:Uncharacterized protein n=1 Tax=Asterophora parasitica TaxID=117018 RepID=A0A9P7G2J2_9AGAR|nr:hypothetical protein DXG03_006675 [Asterophora parasitica]
METRGLENFAQGTSEVPKAEDVEVFLGDDEPEEEDDEYLLLDQNSQTMDWTGPDVKHVPEAEAYSHPSITTPSSSVVHEQLGVPREQLPSQGNRHGRHKSYDNYMIHGDFLGKIRRPQSDFNSSVSSTSEQASTLMRPDSSRPSYTIPWHGHSHPPSTDNSRPTQPFVPTRHPQMQPPGFPTSVENNDALHILSRTISSAGPSRSAVNQGDGGLGVYGSSNLVRAASTPSVAGVPGQRVEWPSHSRAAMLQPGGRLTEDMTAATGTRSEAAPDSDSGMDWFSFLSGTGNPRSTAPPIPPGSMGYKRSDTAKDPMGDNGG